MASDRDPIAWLRELVESATPGQWAPCSMDMYILGGDGHFVAEVRGFGAEVSGQRPPGTQAANARAIAALRNVAPALLAVVEVLGADHGEACPTPYDFCTCGVERARESARDALDAAIRAEMERQG